MIGLYELVKWIHVLSATILFGLGMGTAFYMLMAWRSGRPVLAAGIGRLVVRADWIFTGTSGVVQPVSGIALILLAGWDPWSGWLVATYLLYALAFACWVPVVVLQIRATRLAEQAEAAGTPLPEAYHRAMRLWFTLGWPAFIALMAVFLLMVGKPG